MRRYTSHRSLSTLAELNITPLLDLAFVLLIIFMITTPLIENRLDLLVPTSATATTPVTPGETLILEVTRTGEMRLQGVSHNADALEALLLARRAENPDLAIVIRPDRLLPVQQFIDVMDILKRVGIGRVGVMTRPQEETR